MAAARTLTVPLREDADGTLRVAGTRVTLDTIVAVFKRGSGPEEICRDFSTLDLADVYAVLAYYLRHRAELDAYLGQREQEAAMLQRELEARFRPEGLKDRLLARKAAGAHPL